MATLATIQRVLSSHPAILAVTIQQVATFINLARHLRRDILLVQPAAQPEDEPPEYLSDAILRFLADACDLSYEQATILWSPLKFDIWHANPIDKYILFDQYGLTHGLLPAALFPPRHTCKNDTCQRTLKGQLLTKAEQRDATLYTLDHGPVATKHVHLQCEYCKITYELNFYVKGPHRYYYDFMPDIIQVASHVFLEKRVIDLFDNLANLSWTSFTNCARLYNLTFGQKITPNLSHPPRFTTGLTQQNIWDGFVIKALLLDSARRQSNLVVPKGEQKNRFTDAIKERNLRIQLYGQPELKHYCNKCVRFYKDANGIATHKVSVVVIDGVTVGHPCCAHPKCQIPLSSNRDRFCSQHAPSLSTICAIVDCPAVVAPTAELPNSMTCALVEHKAVEITHRLRGESRFQLQMRLQRARIAHPNSAVPEEIEDPSMITDDDCEDDYMITTAGMAIAPSPSPGPTSETVDKPHDSNPKPRKLRAQFGRRRTHNEELFVAPCGIILARETFFGAEGVASVIEMIKRVYHTGGPFKPNHIFFDNNCTLSKMVRDDPFFQGIGLSVDVFHFKCKHSVTDEWCQSNCNPEAFPELRGEGDQGWFFNSSIAEQTNVWIGGYHAICREMLAERYCFFLDEMIMRRNEMTRDKLRREEPGYWP